MVETIEDKEFETAKLDFNETLRSRICKEIRKNVSSNIVKRRILDTPYNPKDLNTRMGYEDVFAYATYYGATEYPSAMISGLVEKIEAGILVSDTGKEENVIYLEANATLYDDIDPLGRVGFRTIVRKSDLPDKVFYKNKKYQRFDNFWNYIHDLDNSVTLVSKESLDETWVVEE